MYCTEVSNAALKKNSTGEHTKLQMPSLVVMHPKPAMISVIHTLATVRDQGAGSFRDVLGQYQHQR